MTGELLNDKYKLDNLIGEGGSAYVYVGVDLENQKKVAVKQLKQPLYAMDEATILRQRFLREAHLQSSLKHSNIIAVHEILETDSDIFIIMEFVEGTSLKHFLKPYHAQGGAPLPLVADLFTQLLEGLAFAHENHIIHRDIKPSNLMIRPDHILKIADFGIARGLADPQLTQTGLLLGTPLYMSPEQCRGEREIGPTTDLYSVGIALFEALTGRTPFEVTNPSLSHYQLIQQHLFDKPPLLRSLRPELPAALDTVLEKALAKTPEERFADAHSFADALKNALSGKAVISPRVSSSAEASRKARLEDQLPSGSQTIPDDPLLMAALQQPRRPVTAAHSRDAVPNREELLSMARTSVTEREKRRSVQETIAHAETTAAPSFDEKVDHALSEKTVAGVSFSPGSEQHQASARSAPIPVAAKQRKGLWKQWTIVIVILLGMVGGTLYSISQKQKKPVGTNGGSSKPKHFFALSKSLRPRPPARITKPVRRKPAQARKVDKTPILQGMVRIDGGWFRQGAGSHKDNIVFYRMGKNNQLKMMKNNHPQRRVHLPSFWLDRREVRAGEYEQCVQAKFCRPIYVSGRYFGSSHRRRVSVSRVLSSEKPMSFVPWKYAQRYCKWLNKRLPTEAEWERAARGTKGSLYPWGNRAPTCQKATFKGCSNAVLGEIHSSVQKKGPTSTGIYDLAGNLWEWTQDCYSAKAYSRTKIQNPVYRRKRCRLRVLRGGSYLLPASSMGLRSYYRHSLRPYRKQKDVGFRCARSAEK